uniref:serine O-acetyltransferase n=1 Tax=Oryza punctata TaxID=4537 RepID=A0A0E0KA15_ORYPU
MAACVDKWQPAAYPCRLPEKFYCILPDCSTDLPMAAASAALAPAASGSSGDYAHRAAHALWSDNRRAPALLLQSRASEVFGVDIHPGARIGCGILLDHATGVVIGETAVVGYDVSILHGVTLGGTGKESGDRHPKVGDGVLIGAGASVLGNVHIGDGAKIGAGAVVLRDVADGTTAVGNPAKPIGKKAAPQRRPEELPGVTMEQRWSN